MCPDSVPWPVVAAHTEQAKKNHGGQSLERIAARGGLSPTELAAVLEDRRWRPMDDRDAVHAIKRALGDKNPWP